MTEKQPVETGLNLSVPELLNGFLGQADITQAELARRVNVHPSQVSRWFSGERPIANYKKALGVVEALELSTISGDLFLMRIGYRPSDDFLNQTGVYAAEELTNDFWNQIEVYAAEESTKRRGTLMSRIVDFYKNENIPQEDKEFFTKFLELIV